MSDMNTAILERLEKVVDSLQDNSVKMGQLLAVHNEKLHKQDKIDEVLFEKVDSVHREVNRKADEIKKGCERDILMIDDRLRIIEKKMWTIAGALTIISFLVSPIGQKFIQRSLTTSSSTATLIEPMFNDTR
jgi:NurA-like 5'-3' nuclease